MAEILVLVEHDSGTVKKVTLEMLTKARDLGEPSAVFVGTGLAAAKDKLAAFGAQKVYVAEGEEYGQYLTEPTVEVLAKVVADSSPAAILTASTPFAKDVATRLAARLGTGVLADIVDLASGFVATQSVFGGSMTVKATVSKGTPVLTVKPNSFPPTEASAAAAEVAVSVSLSDAAKRAKVVERVATAKGGRPSVEEASIVVSGGRGMANGENFAIIEALADTLGAAVGASRAAVDAGWYPQQNQVGQTGKMVSPQLYIAAGISGAIQHRAGMQTSKTIVAINKDAEAPIFAIADFGVVGDLFKVVPQATDEIKKRKG